MSAELVSGDALELIEVEGIDNKESEEEPSVQLNGSNDTKKDGVDKSPSVESQGQQLCGRKDRILTTVLSVLVASIPALLFGCTLGFPSPVLLDLMTPEQGDLQFDTFLSDLFSVSLDKLCGKFIKCKCLSV